MLGALWTCLHLYSLVSLGERGALCEARADLKFGYGWSGNPPSEAELEERVEQQRDQILYSWRKQLTWQFVVRGALAFLLFLSGFMILGKVRVWRPLVLISALLMLLGTLFLYRGWMFWPDPEVPFDYCGLPFQKIAAHGFCIMLPVLTIACGIAFWKLEEPVSDEPSAPTSYLNLR